MKNRLCTRTFLPLVAVLVVSVAYHGLARYFAFEQHVACSIAQATNLTYGTIGNISLLLFYVVMLALSVTKMSQCTLSCIRTTYKACQEHTAPEKKESAE